MVQFLKFCSERTELFVPAPSEGEYKFFHRSFFEYFYAKYIAGLKHVKEIIRELKKFGYDSEVQELTVAIIKNGDELLYQNLMDSLFEQTRRELQDIKRNTPYFNMLTLIMQVVDDEIYCQEYGKLFVEFSEVFLDAYPENQYMRKMRTLWCNEEIIATHLEECFDKNPEIFDAFYELYKEQASVMMAKRLSKEHIWKPMDLIVEQDLFNLIHYELSLDDSMYSLVAMYADWPRYFCGILKKYSEEVLQNRTN